MMTGVVRQETRCNRQSRLLVAAIVLTASLAMGGCGDDDAVDPQAPVLAAIGDRTVVLGSDLLLAVSASDPQGDEVTLSASGLPEDSYFLPDSGVFCLFADDEELLEDSIQVTFTASDGFHTSSETVDIRVVRPDAAQTDALGAAQSFALAPIGNQRIVAGDELTLQLSATGASPVVYRMYPEPELAPLVTLDPATGAFRFSPTAAQAGEQFEITFQGCVPDGTGCDAIMQVHETVHLVVDPPVDCTQGLPVPTPIPPSNRVVQLVNCSKQQLLGAANAAYKSGQSPFPVLPREKTWVMEPFGTSGNRHVLTIDIPPQWENTKCPPEGCPNNMNPLGPRFWARTGCRYDIATDRAQCETGDCGNKYDCGKAHLAAATGTTIAEWTFYEPVSDRGISYFKDSPDISAVDGVNLNMDIQPVGGDPNNPFDTPPNNVDKNWLNSNYPLTKHGQDLRADNKCQPANFQIKRSELTFVARGNDGKPLGGDHTIACLSNCGRYAYPLVPQGPGGLGLNCDPSDRTSQCYRWKVFCCPLGSQAYDQLCDSPGPTPRPDDALCNVTPPVPPAMGEIAPYEHGAFFGACWFRGTPTDLQPKNRCSCRAFIKGDDCPSDVCTHPFKDEPGAQPPFGHCRDVSSDPDACIGDDTFHRVMPKAYSWPNDPQVYGANAPAYRIIFAPGGTDVPVSESGPFPSCSTLSTSYGYELNQRICATAAPGAIFGGARPSPNCRRFCSGDHSIPCTVETDCQPSNGNCSSDCAFGGCVPDIDDPTKHHCNSWECDVIGQSNAVICRWDTGPTSTETQ